MTPMARQFKPLPAFGPQEPRHRTRGGRASGPESVPGEISSYGVGGPGRLAGTQDTSQRLGITNRLAVDGMIGCQARAIRRNSFQ